MIQEPQTKSINEIGMILSDGYYPPFNTKAALPQELSIIWSSERGYTPISFGQAVPLDPDYLPLGDVAFINNEPVNASTMLLFANTPDDPTALAHPTGFVWILDDKGSGNTNNISYFWPIAPQGYVAMGLAFGSDTPNPLNYWCVKSEYVVNGGANYQYWNDSGANWKSHNGDLSTPIAPNSTPAPGTAFLVPATFLSNEQGNQGNVLIVKQSE